MPKPKPEMAGEHTLECIYTAARIGLLDCTCPTDDGKPKPDLTVTLNPLDVASLSNQMRLGNGCVCDSGCDSCWRLAEAFEAMEAALRKVVDDLSTVPCRAINEARAALALARKVRP